MDSILTNLGHPSEYDIRVEMRPRRIKARIRANLRELLRVSEFVGTAFLHNRRKVAVVERMAFMADYLILKPSDLTVRLLYAHLEPWGA